MATILCVDTDEQYARHVCAILQNAGHTAVYTNTGDSVLSLIEKHGADLLLCEVMLPDVCGFEVSRRLRAHAELYMVPIVLMSSMSEEAEVKHGYSQGVDAYLPKPVDARILTSCVSQKLAEAEAARQEEPITGLYSSKRIKIGVQRAITLRKPFALTYVELLAVPNFSRVYGADARDRALRHMARLLQKWGEHRGGDFYEAGHMGAGHFVCIMNPEVADIFCSELLEYWEAHLPKLHASLKPVQGGKNAASGNNLPDLSLIICVTGSGVLGAHATDEYFDTLAQLRSKALAEGASGVFTDKRRKV